MGKNRSWLCFCTGAVLVSCAQASFAQDARDQIIENRIANFRDMGSAYKNIGDELKSGHPNKTKIQSGAKTIADYSTHLLSWFPPGSEPPPEISQSWIDKVSDWLSSEDSAAPMDQPKSHAKPEIWKQQAKFKSDAKNLQLAAAKMKLVSRTGDAVAIAAQFRALGVTCKSCHDVFRKEMH